LPVTSGRLAHSPGGHAFSEAEGLTTANDGSLGGWAPFVQTDEHPLFTDNVPAGAFAPTGNGSALDFGAIAASQGGRAADLTTASGDGTLERSTPSQFVVG